MSVVDGEWFKVMSMVLVGVGIEREAAKDERDKAVAERDRYAARIKKLEAERDALRGILK